MPTLSLFLYILCIGAVYLFRISCHSWVVPYVELVMIAAPILLFLLSLPSMISLDMQMQGKMMIEKGTPGEVRFQFRSKSLLPVSRVSVTFRVENHFSQDSYLGTVSYYTVARGSRSVPIPTQYCGKLTVSVLRWECRDLLGFFKIRRKCPAPFSCIILPVSAGPAQPLNLDNALKQQVYWKPKYGGGYSEEHDLRDYRPGDPTTSIHWKLSSKTDKLIVREALEQVNSQIFAVLSQTGEEDRGLEILRWLSNELIQKELPHCIVSDTLYEVDNENECTEALKKILSRPFENPCDFDSSKARCIFFISGGEVSVQ